MDIRANNHVIANSSNIHQNNKYIGEEKLIISTGEGSVINNIGCSVF